MVPNFAPAGGMISTLPVGKGSEEEYKPGYCNESTAVLIGSETLMLPTPVVFKIFPCGNPGRVHEARNIERKREVPGISDPRVKSIAS